MFGGFIFVWAGVSTRVFPAYIPIPQKFRVKSSLFVAPRLSISSSESPIKTGLVVPEISPDKQKNREIL